MSCPKRFLVIRFSSIGDVVLTTPVLRSLKAAYPEAQLHVLTKAAYAELLRPLPFVDAVHTLGPSLVQTALAMRKLGFSHVVDLHKNLRSHVVKYLAGAPHSSFPKSNAHKRRLVKQLTQTPVPHIVTRYAQAIAPLGAALDEEGLELHIPAAVHQQAMHKLQTALGTAAKPWAIALGARHATKQWPEHHMQTLVASLGQPVVLLGGPEDAERAKRIAAAAHAGRVAVWAAAGELNLLESAAVLQACRYLITGDTGLMHIGAALGVPLVTLWGSTIPGFGMAPYKAKAQMLEVPNLPCRPCSRIGYDACPQGHFRCMEGLLPKQVLQAAKALTENP